MVNAAGKSNQLEELLIWKLSDELRLSPLEEKKFSETVRALSQKKAEMNQSLQFSIEKLSKLKTIKEKEEELGRYRKALERFARLGEEEFDKLKPILGSERMAQYLVIKQDLSNRIKTMLVNPDNGKGGKALPQPKLIEEK
jgi:response regulator of citrate/malate metabolism